MHNQNTDTTSYDFKVLAKTFESVGQSESYPILEGDKMHY